MSVRPRLIVGLFGVIATLSISSAVVAQPRPAIGLSIDEPRAYGHVVGDHIQRTLRLQLPAGFQLERASLPSPGAQSYWLDLAVVDIRAAESSSGPVVVRLDYQLFYAPLQATRRELPALDLAAANAAGERITRRAPAFVFTMSPILELDPDARFGDPDNDLLLADAMPVRPAVAGPRRATFAALAITLFALLVWAWAAGYLSASARGPFARARVSLRRQRRAHEPPEVAKALRTVHRAFDETAGQAVFADDLDVFIAAHPVFADLVDDIAAFFEFSRRYFFAGAAPAAGDNHGLIDRLERLVQGCRKRELKA
ncbi:MxaA protein [Salinisphaera sp. S4-8]|uniref:nonribosomal peptide synthetase MxaA n=1 Tax=Salinisphaera sp. S4-8 TaxID=633357 RepID=UPI003342BD29